MYKITTPLTGGARLPRRRFLSLGIALAVGLLAAACGPELEERINLMNRSRQRLASRTPEKAVGRLMARPGQPQIATPPGLHRLGLDPKRDALLYVPAGYRPDHPAPLAVMLHGSGGNSDHGIGQLRHLADEAGLILFAPASQEYTWDIIVDDYGPDIEVLDQALTRTFDRCAIDPTRLAVGGFSDGASYALSIGLMNGDLFTHIIAFSPGFMAPAEQRGAPHIYISHGTDDTVLPIERCSRRLVPALRQAGYDLLYHEFNGPHTIPPDISQEAVTWLIENK